jgi:hypothetical protein
MVFTQKKEKKVGEGSGHENNSEQCWRECTKLNGLVDCRILQPLVNNSAVCILKKIGMQSAVFPAVALQRLVFHSAWLQKIVL